MQTEKQNLSKHDALKKRIIDAKMVIREPIAKHYTKHIITLDPSLDNRKDIIKIGNVWRLRQSDKHITDLIEQLANF